MKTGKKTKAIELVEAWRGLGDDADTIASLLFGTEQFKTPEIVMALRAGLSATLEEVFKAALPFCKPADLLSALMQDRDAHYGIQPLVRTAILCGLSAQKVIAALRELGYNYAEIFNAVSRAASLSVIIETLEGIGLSLGEIFTAAKEADIKAADLIVASKALGRNETRFAPALKAAGYSPVELAQGFPQNDDGLRGLLSLFDAAGYDKELYGRALGQAGFLPRVINRSRA